MNSLQTAHHQQNEKWKQRSKLVNVNFVRWYQHKFRLLAVRNIHLNINSLLPKIDKLCDIAKLSNAAIIGKTQSKLGN